MSLLKMFYKKIQSFLKSILKTQFSNKTSSQFSLEAFFSHSLWIKAKKYTEKPAFIVKKNWKFLVIFLVALLISDLLLIKSHNFLLPDKALPPLALLNRTSRENLSSELYKNIWENNIFHTGPIPMHLQEDAPVSLEPVRSSLPFKLKGAIVHANPSRSVAVIMDSDNKTLAYQKGGVIENQAEIREIQQNKVIFFNQNNNRLEYVVIPEESKPFKLSYEKDKLKASKSLLVRKKGSNEFQVKRSDINQYLQRLPEILNQARVVPHPEGWKFSSVNKGSIFEKLGFKKNDILKEVNGENLAGVTPEEALEIYESLKLTSEFKTLVLRDGREVYSEYNVSEDAPPL